MAWRSPGTLEAYEHFFQAADHAQIQDQLFVRLYERDKQYLENIVEAVSACEARQQWGEDETGRARVGNTLSSGRQRSCLKPLRCPFHSQQAMNPVQRLQGLVDTAILHAPHLDWHVVDPRVIRYLKNHVSSLPWV